MFSFRLSRQFRVLCHNRNADSSKISAYIVQRDYHIESPLHQHAEITQHQQNGPLANGRLVRCYTPQASQTFEKGCWNCKKPTDRRTNMLCTECGSLQEVDTKLNYFDLLKCPRAFDVDSQQLTRNFRELQAIAHPDKFSNKSEREQMISADWSSLINKAYKTISMPIERGQYLLQLHDLQIPKDNSALDKEFLMEMMERNEEVEGADTVTELRQLEDRIITEMNDMAKQLTRQFNGNDLNGATATIVQMKYLRSLQTSIKTKLQSILI